MIRNLLLLVALLLVLPLAAYAQTPIHQWTFNDDGTDAVGSAHGTLHNGASIVNGAVALDGVNDYVSLPIGSTIAGLTDSTFLTWVTWDSFQAPWSVVFSFNSSTNNSMMLFPRNGRSDFGSAIDTLRFTIFNTRPVVGEQQLNSPNHFPVGQLTCVAVVIDAANTSGHLYVDGIQEAQGALTLSPSSLGNTPNNWLGRSQFADPYLDGSIDEFRIYGAALSETEVHSICAAGPTGIDSDGDGVNDDVDVCDDTAIAEDVPAKRLGVNRFALTTDGSTEFDTTPPPGGGNGPGLSFTTADTAGCSCEQIIDALGLGSGHAKFGCSISAMEAWIALVNP